MLPCPEAGRVALIGDTHADLDWTRRVLKAVSDKGIDVAIQVGDFGWWPGPGTKRLAEDGILTPFFPGDIAREARSLGIKLMFIDGNHEHHHSLRDWALENGWTGNAGPVEIIDGLWYLPRGCAWEWEGVKFRAFGGAFSIDRNRRVLGSTWFPEEVPSWEEVERAIAAGPADVLISHDHPNFDYELQSSFRVSESQERSSRLVRDQVAQIVKDTNPKLVVHGHWHYRYSKQIGQTRIEGLSDDWKDGSVGILDLNTLKFEMLTHRLLNASSDNSAKSWQSDLNAEIYQKMYHHSRR